MIIKNGLVSFDTNTQKIDVDVAMPFDQFAEMFGQIAGIKLKVLEMFGLEYGANIKVDSREYKSLKFVHYFVFKFYDKGFEWINDAIDGLLIPESFIESGWNFIKNNSKFEYDEIKFFDTLKMV